MISITQKAIKKIDLIRSDLGAGFLRISVDGGGCSGFSYSFKFENNYKNKEDIINSNKCKLIRKFPIINESGKVKNNISTSFTS